jgi:bacillithiol biosynthesis cysteine-adding enzyme BshC
MEWSGSGLLAPLPSALLAGRDLDLLRPMRFVVPGSAPELAEPRVDRTALAAALGAANASYGHPHATALAAKLADAQTRVVVTGQQPGLFGGPLYALTKMAAAVRWAEELERSGTPALAVFWVATEDHDWTEVAHAAFAGADGARDLGLGADPSPLLPVGMRTFGAELDRVFAEWAALQPGPREDAWRATLARWYRPEARFGEAFCRLAAHLLGARCPLLLDAMLPAVKAAEQPLLRALVERRGDVARALTAAEARIEARGYALQVEPQPGAGQLFLLHEGARRRVLWEGTEGFALRGGPTGWPIERLLAAVDENPGVISPGALSRPAIQDAILGTTLQVLGPGELSYMAQASAIYPVLGVAAPAVALRPQVLLLEAAQRRHLDASDLPSLLDAKKSLERRVAEKSGPNLVAAARAAIADQLLGLRGPSVALDPSLERPLEKTREQVERALEAFGGKVDAAVARRDATQLRRLARLRAACLPLGGLQERVLSIAHFAARGGEGFAQVMLDALTLDPRGLQVLDLEIQSDGLAPVAADAEAGAQP